MLSKMFANLLETWDDALLNVGIQTRTFSCEIRTVVLLFTLMYSLLTVTTIIWITIKVVLSKQLISHIKDRSVFITGCDTGFGNYLAKTLDRKGVNVFAGCLTKQGANKLEQETSSRLTTILVDVAKKESVKGAFDLISRRLAEKGLWGLVNNAGVIAAYAPAELTSLEQFEKVIQVNLMGTIYVTHTFLPLVRKSRGRIVNVSSVMATCPFPGISHYVTSKAAIKMFTSCLRRELLRTGVTAHTIEPGAFNTALTDHSRLTSMMQTGLHGASEEQRQFYGGNIAKYVMFAIKQRHKYVNSHPINVADAMAHALLARYPETRYLVGLDAHLFFRLMSLIPERAGDFIFGWPKPYGKMFDDFIH
ncbi:17-beta-hydroxysteroid dehydrogenase type 6-like isoform X2 [Dreissena polymorpha]|uniref:17-beta-hydroxysteroid dehydrogenase type 6-like isoform X2 n=1 Tax=Dreissena polymorpha TaxID=45954 RepID=UPI0022655962|nr:17-beta-hydroxysteroid dehydrogenase type 6-like isoform X2 [Dreissena polymorpha]